VREKRKQEILKLLLKEGELRTSKIAERLGKSKSYVRKLLIELRKEGLIESVNLHIEKVHRLTPKGRALLGQQPDIVKARVHNVRLTCRVLQIDWAKIAEVGRRIKMKNWDAYVVNLKDLVNLPNIPDVKIQFNDANIPTALIYLPEFYASSKWEAAKIIQNYFCKIARALQVAGIILDQDWIKEPKCVYGEYAFKTQEPLDPGYELKLGRPAMDPYGNTLNAEARAWVDESNGREAETNDADYTHKYLMMPEYVAELYKDFRSLNGFLNKFERVLDKQSEIIERQNENLSKSSELQLVFAENINSHIPYVQNAAKALEKITEVVEVQHKQHTQFIEAVKQMNGSMKYFFLAFAILVLVLLVKEVVA
jgi:Mn-dependent DtxR family transcriptional regulator